MSRPPKALEILRHNPQVEDQFVDSLEKWRETMKLEKIVLVGHSLGGFLSACYALKYPERVEKLILVSPVGLPVKPDDFEDGLNARVCVVVLA